MNSARSTESTGLRSQMLPKTEMSDTAWPSLGALCSCGYRIHYVIDPVWHWFRAHLNFPADMIPGYSVNPRRTTYEEAQMAIWWMALENLT